MSAPVGAQSSASPVSRTALGNRPHLGRSFYARHDATSFKSPTRCRRPHTLQKQHGRRTARRRDGAASRWRNSRSSAWFAWRSGNRTYKFAEANWKAALDSYSTKLLYKSFLRIVGTDESIADNKEWLSKALRELMKHPTEMPSCHLANVLSRDYGHVNWASIPNALQIFAEAYKGIVPSWQFDTRGGTRVGVFVEAPGTSRDVRRSIASLIWDAAELGHLDVTNQDVQAALRLVSDSLSSPSRASLLDGPGESGL